MAKQTTQRRSPRRDRDELEQSYRKVSTGGKYRKRRKKISKAASIATVCVAVFTIVLIIIGSIYLYNLDQTGVFAEGITVAGVDVGGMTKSEAIRAVTEATENTYTQQPMTVKVLKSEIQIKPNVSGAKLNVRAAIKAAYKHGKPGKAFDISPYLNLDEAAIRNALNELGAKYSSTLSQPKAEIMGTAPDQVLIVTLGKPEYGLDMNALYETVLSAYSANTFSAEGVCELILPTPLDLQPYLTQYYVAPIDAYIDEKTHEIIEGVDGYGFDLAAAEIQLQEAADGSTVEIPFIAIKPAVTAESLNKLLFRDTLATWTAIDAGSSDGRNTNLRLACEAINGIIINPGEEFSYNNALGERTEERGYQPGPSFYNGKTVQTIGGGICQVSSALYYCAMMADLEITQRDNHGFAVSYVPLGMDAAVSWPTLDFRFKNNTNYPIRIEASADGGSTIVTLVGTDEKDYYVKLEYEVLSTTSYSTTYQTLSSNNPDGYKDGDYIIQPHTGYSIQTYRCKYNKNTDELISRDSEASSKYSKCDAVICKISDEPSNPDPGIGNGGVTEDGALP